MGCFCIASLCWCHCHCLLSLLHFSIIPSLISFSLVAPVCFFPFVLPFNFHEAATFLLLLLSLLLLSLFFVRVCMRIYVCMPVWTFCANDWNFVEGEKDVCPSAIYIYIIYEIPLLFFHFSEITTATISLTRSGITKTMA